VRSSALLAVALGLLGVALLVGPSWLLAKGGLGTSNQFESAAFVRSAPGVEYPDIQYHFLPLAVRYDGRSAVRGHGFQAHVDSAIDEQVFKVVINLGQMTFINSTALGALIQTH